MSEWSEGVDETDDDAFTWHTSAVEGGGGGGGMSVPDKVTLLREVEMVGVLSFFSVFVSVVAVMVSYFAHSI